MDANPDPATVQGFLWPEFALGRFGWRFHKRCAKGLPQPLQVRFCFAKA